MSVTINRDALISPKLEKRDDESISQFTRFSGGFLANRQKIIKFTPAIAIGHHRKPKPIDLASPKPASS